MLYIFRHVFSLRSYSSIHTISYFSTSDMTAAIGDCNQSYVTLVPKGRCSKADTRGAVAAAAGVLPLAALTAVTAALAADSSSAEAHPGRCQRCRRCWSPEGQTQPTGICMARAPKEWLFAQS